MLHGCFEDVSMLYNLCGVKIAHVFDTQLAHRLLSKLSNNNFAKDSNISLNNLISIYFPDYKNHKLDIKKEMDANKELFAEVNH